MIKEKIPPCMIFINKDGKWFHKGAEMINRGIIRDFYSNLEADSFGNYIITLGADKCYVEVEDTPFVVTRVEFKGEKKEGYIAVLLSDDTVEKLDPGTLKVGKDNVLYCSIRGNSFTARFSRAAYYQIAAYIKEEGGKYYLPLNDKKYYLG